MKRFIEEADRGQWPLLPECLDDFIDGSNPVRVIDGRHPLRPQARNAEASLAWPINAASANQGGRCRARQQDCADGLGHHGPGREIQGAETVAGGMRHASRQIGDTPIGEGMTT
jgi:hypothetical protein